LAARFARWEHVVDQLIAAHPSAAQVVDKDGCLPLHVAAANPDLEAMIRKPSEGNHDRDAALAASEAVAKMLFDAYPNGATTRNGEGFIPLHVAARCQASEALVRALLDRHRGAAKCADGQRFLPIHLAAANRASKVSPRARAMRRDRDCGTTMIAMPQRRCATAPLRRAAGQPTGRCRLSSPCLRHPDD
jgi:hypothetical protein